jgi:hypothetical protein
MKRWAFHSQTFFLMEKINQMLETPAMLAKYSTVQIRPSSRTFSYAKAHVLGILMMRSGGCIKNLYIV